MSINNRKLKKDENGFWYEEFDEYNVYCDVFATYIKTFKTSSREEAEKLFNEFIDSEETDDEELIEDMSFDRINQLSISNIFKKSDQYLVLRNGKKLRVSKLALNSDFKPREPDENGF